jgi:hypothetical protein
MNNPTAFPSLHWVAPQGHSANENPQGMTLRDYFAAKAMQAYLDGYEYSKEFTMLTISEKSYEMADAMLKAREA